MVQYLNGGLKTGLKKPDYGPICPVLEWSAKCNYHLNTGHPYCPVFRCLVFRLLLYSDPLCFLVFGLFLRRSEAIWAFVSNLICFQIIWSLSLSIPKIETENGAKCYWELSPLSHFIGKTNVILNWIWNIVLLCTLHLRCIMFYTLSLLIAARS